MARCQRCYSDQFVNARCVRCELALVYPGRRQWRQCPALMGLECRHVDCGLMVGAPPLNGWENIVRQCRSGHWCEGAYCNVCGLNVHDPDLPLMPWADTPGQKLYRVIWPNRLPPGSPTWLVQAATYSRERENMISAGGCVHQFVNAKFAEPHFQAGPQSEYLVMMNRSNHLGHLLRFMSDWVKPDGVWSLIHPGATQVMNTLRPYNQWPSRLIRRDGQHWTRLLWYLRSALNWAIFMGVRPQELPVIRHGQFPTRQENIEKLMILSRHTIDFVQANVPSARFAELRLDDYMDEIVQLLDLLGRSNLPDFRNPLQGIWPMARRLADPIGYREWYSQNFGPPHFDDELAASDEDIDPLDDFFDDVEA